MNTNEISKMSSKALERRERAARRKLAEIAHGGDPGRGLATDEANRARDARIATAREARTARDTARAELRSREAERQTVFGRLFADQSARKRRRDGTPTPFEAERVAFHEELKAEHDLKNTAEHERRRAAGFVWEPVGPAGGIEIAAVFSSAVVWEATANEIRDGVHHEPSLHLRDIAHLWWLLNAIEAGGGHATLPAGPGRIPPHWPGYDREAIDGIKYREDSVNHLAKLGYLIIERGADTLTIAHGPVTVKLAASFRETVGKQAA